ncbi:MAG: glutamine synthetase [Streptosporangiales bacterium]|nr:glutamine synthetase [Streptosporangiales bacterium]
MTGDSGSTAGTLVPMLREQGVEGVVLAYVDVSGVNRIKTVPVAALERTAVWGVGMSPVFDTFLSNDVPIKATYLGGPDGDLRLVPDLGALVPLAAQPGWAWAPVDRYTQDHEPYVACSRLFAQRMVERARAVGVTYRMGIEIEWAISEGTGDEFVPACVGPAYSMTRLTELSDYAAELLAALRAEGIEVQQLHPEYSDGQFEVSVAAADPVRAADDSVLVRQTIRAVSAQHGLRVSFAPSVLVGHVGNGGHVHLSAWREGGNLLAGGDGRYGMTAAGESMLAGVLDALPALQAIGAPSPASYLRQLPSHWAGVYRCWGRETRETAMRFITGSAGDEGRAANAEVKCVDLAANPYLLAGALLAASLAGLDAEATLPEEMVGDPAWHDEDELASRGVHRLPRSLDEAATAFANSQLLRDALGVPLFDAILAVRRAEIERFEGAEPHEIAEAVRWVY